MSAIERDGKRWTVADIDALERERDDYKDRWEVLGRVSRNMLVSQAAELQEAVAEAERLRVQWRKADEGWIAAKAEVERLTRLLAATELEVRYAAGLDDDDPLGAP